MSAVVRRRRGGALETHIATVEALAPLQYGVTETQVRDLLGAVLAIFRVACREASVPEATITAILRKFNDAGRRSAPWRPTSSVLPGRPQDGNDGNRRNRWLFPEDHKYYATEVVATLVEIKYLLQTLSMSDAPPTAAAEALNLFFPWLIEAPVVPGAYRDPLQLTPISFTDFAADRRLVESGHLSPLDRGGAHHPANTFLMLFRSNQMQGNQTVAELLDVMAAIVARHAERRDEGDVLESRIQQQG